MNDLQIWPEACNKDYDPHSLGTGDLLEFCSEYGQYHYIYEVTGMLNAYHGSPLRQGDIAMELMEIGITTAFELPEHVDRAELFAHVDPITAFIKRFKLKLKHKDKILKTNMCKVIAAKFFISDELNDLLLELEI